MEFNFIFLEQRSTKSTGLTGSTKNGFSLVEILIVLAMMSTASLAMMSLVANSNNQISRIQFRFDNLQTAGLVSTVLSNPVNCLGNLANLAVQPKINLDQLDKNQINFSEILSGPVSGSPAVAVAKNDNTDPGRSFKSISMTNFSALSADQVLATLILTPREIKGFQPDSNKIIPVALTLNLLDPSSARSVVSCKAIASSGVDGIGSGSQCSGVLTRANMSNCLNGRKAQLLDGAGINYLCGNTFYHTDVANNVIIELKKNAAGELDVLAHHMPTGGTDGGGWQCTSYSYSATPYKLCSIGSSGDCSYQRTGTDNTTITFKVSPTSAGINISSSGCKCATSRLGNADSGQTTVITDCPPNQACIGTQSLGYIE